MIEKFDRESFTEMLWKNGGGKTIELYRILGVSDLFNLRLSIADIGQNGAFSVFPGIDRTILLLEGHGFHLKSTNIDEPLTAKHRPYFFRGEESINCTLTQGACRDFNVMINRNFGRAHVEVKEFSSIKAEHGLEFVYELDSQVLFKLDKGDVWNASLGISKKVIWVTIKIF